MGYVLLRCWHAWRAIDWFDRLKLLFFRKIMHTVTGIKYFSFLFKKVRLLTWGIHSRTHTYTDTQKTYIQQTIKMKPKANITITLKTQQLMNTRHWKNTYTVWSRSTNGILNRTTGGYLERRRFGFGLRLWNYLSNDMHTYNNDWNWCRALTNTKTQLK